MAVNGARGEVVALLAGAERRLCLTLGALAEIETGLRLEGLSGLADRMRALRARDLIDSGRLLLTPHLGYTTEATFRLFYTQTVDAIRAYLAGDPIRVLS